MDIKGQIVKSKATGVEAEVVGIEKGKVLVSMGMGKPLLISLDNLIMSDELRTALLAVINSKHTRTPKEIININSVEDHKRSSKEIIDAFTTKRIHKGECFGTNSRKIYDAFCKNDNFKWDINQAKNYGRQGASLFSRNATKEGYAVWMIAYSSFNGKAVKSGRVENTLLEDGNIIETFNNEIHTYAIGEKRIVFVKSKQNQYIYWGVVETTEYDDIEKIAKYKYIANEYPL